MSITGRVESKNRLWSVPFPVYWFWAFGASWGYAGRFLRTTLDDGISRNVPHAFPTDPRATLLLYFIRSLAVPEYAICPSSNRNVIILRTHTCACNVRKTFRSLIKTEIFRFGSGDPGTRGGRTQNSEKGARSDAREINYDSDRPETRGGNVFRNPTVLATVWPHPGFVLEGCQNKKSLKYVQSIEPFQSRVSVRRLKVFSAP